MQLPIGCTELLYCIMAVVAHKQFPAHCRYLVINLNHHKPW